MTEQKNSGKYMEKATVASQQCIADGIFSLWLQTDQIAGAARAGQFVSVYCRDGSRLLPRPISICEAQKDTGLLRLVYRTAGAGTSEFSKLSEGDVLDVTGPLGNGFPVSLVRPEETSLLVAGGIGVPPMVQLAKTLPGRKIIVPGYRDHQMFLLEELEREGTVLPATEDGSAGVHGNVLDCIREHDLKADHVFACGPMPMLRAVKEWAMQQKTDCWLSLEERMACGIGACLACVCRTTKTDEHSRVNNARVCAEGPVFAAQDVQL